MRVGLATGLVVVGDLTGSGEAQERGIVGETPNLAARLQGIAEPGMVVIADGTRRLLGNLFELQDLGARTSRVLDDSRLGGVAARARSKAGSRRCTRRARSPWSDARRRFDLLMQRWASAEQGDGQVVLLSGEPGIGKSRLTAALLERLAAEPHARLRYFCSPQHTDSAFHPVIGQIERAAGLSREDTPQTKLDKLDAMLAATATSQRGCRAVGRDAVAAERWPLSASPI